MYAVALADVGIDRRYLNNEMNWKYGAENAKLFPTMSDALQWLYGRGYHDASSGYMMRTGPGTLEIVRIATKPTFFEVVQ